MREKTIEAHLVRRAEMLGGRCWKWTSPGHAGVPDRIVMLPGGAITFVELKAPGKELRPLQRHTLAVIASLGFNVAVIDSKEMVDELFPA